MTPKEKPSEVLDQDVATSFIHAALALLPEPAERGRALRLLRAALELLSES